MGEHPLIAAGDALAQAVRERWTGPMRDCDCPVCSAAGEWERLRAEEREGVADREHDARIDMAGAYVPPRSADKAATFERVMLQSAADIRNRLMAALEGRQADAGRFTISVSFLDDGQKFVQAEGDPYPLGIYKETGYEGARLVLEAFDAILHWRNAHA